MSTIEKLSSDKNLPTGIYNFIDYKIPASELRKILERNAAYFNLIHEGSAGVCRVKFELVDGLIIMRTFAVNGKETARYSVRDDYSLYLYLGTVSDNGLYCNNGMSITEYEEDENGVMYYQILNEDGFDIVGDCLTYEDAVSFVDANNEIELT